jgi:hypothetical protein
MDDLFPAHCKVLWTRSHNKNQQEKSITHLFDNSFSDTETSRLKTHRARGSYDAGTTV